MASHTPGPWKAIDSGEDNWCVTDQHGNQISAVFTDKQDAHLIAAAPELLAIAKTVHAETGKGEPCPVCWRAPHAINCMVSAAIAKAEGKDA